jgi:predicted O-methyltransferase YrrM
MTERLKTVGKVGLRKVFELAQRVGLDLLPRHFYSGIPDIHELRSSASWRRAYSLVGVAGVDTASQLAFVNECVSEELRDGLRRTDFHADACTENGAIGYGSIEAAFLYCFISTKRPRKVVQVGCGVSTAVIQRAAIDGGFDVELVCVDPFPTEFLKRSSAAGGLRLIAEPAQTVPLEVLTELGAGDFLFIDSTHTVKPGSEVNRLVLEVLPRLREGVFVHFHDITFPYDYPPTVLTDDLFFWNESVLVQAFLTGNPRYRVRAALSLLHHASPQELQGILPSYVPAGLRDGLVLGKQGIKGHFPSSLYLEVTS